MFYTFVRLLLNVFIRIFIWVKVSGVENIPKKGGFIVCSNHMSLWDPVTIGMTCPRKVRYMAKKELFKFKPFGLLIKWLGAFPVDRSAADMSAFKSAMAVLKDGNPLLIFAQGTRMKEIDLQSAKSGVSLFAVKAKVPVIPVCMTGSYKLFRRLYVNYGEPIYLDEYYEMKLRNELLGEITENIMSKIKDLEVPK